MMLIHNPLTFAEGNAEDLEKAIAMLNEVKESIINAYELKSGLSRAKISHLMDDETWLNAGKALELGFIDGILYSNKDDDEDEEEEETVVVQPQEETEEDENTEEESNEEDKDSKKANKKATDTVVRKVPSYSFSLKDSNDSLMSKISKIANDNKSVGSVDADQLMKRLNLIK